DVALLDRGLRPEPGARRITPLHGAQSAPLGAPGSRTGRALSPASQQARNAPPEWRCFIAFRGATSLEYLASSRYAWLDSKQAEGPREECDLLCGHYRDRMLRLASGAVAEVPRTGCASRREG